MSALHEKPAGQEPTVAPIKRGRSSLWWTLSICAIVLGYGLYTRWQWQKTQHPLQMRVLQLPPSGAGFGVPFLKIHIKGIPPQRDDYQIQGPQWQVQLQRLQWRTNAAAPWKDAPAQLQQQLQEQLERTSQTSLVADGLETRWEQLWLPPGEHRIEGQFSATFYDDNAQNWDGSIHVGEVVTVPTPGPTATPTPPPTIGGIADIQYHIQGTETVVGPNHSSLTYQGKMVDAKGNEVWKSVPRRGQKGFPLTLAPDTALWFRAVQKGRVPSRGFGDHSDIEAFAPLDREWSSAFVPAKSKIFNYKVRVDGSTVPPGSLQAVSVRLVDDYPTPEGNISRAKVQGRTEDEVFVRIAPLDEAVPE